MFQTKLIIYVAIQVYSSFCVSVLFSYTNTNSTTQAKNQAVILGVHLTQHKACHWSCQFYLLRGFEICPLLAIPFVALFQVFVIFAWTIAVVL